MSTKAYPKGGCIDKLDPQSLCEVLEDGLGVRSNDLTKTHPLLNGEDAIEIVPQKGGLFTSTEISTLLSDDLEFSARVACLNAWNDIFARGAIPETMLVQLLVDRDGGLSKPKRILNELSKTAAELGASIAGGHTIWSTEAMIGLTVIGQHGREINGKTGHDVGDLIYLSKGLTAFSILEYFDFSESIDEIIRRDNNLMRQRYQPRESFTCSSSTDISGYGLIGHLSELFRLNHGANLYIDQIFHDPEYQRIRSILEDCKTIPKPLQDILEYAQRSIYVTEEFAAAELALLTAPQTNGPILITSHPSNHNKIQKADFMLVGEVIPERKVCRS